jgi:hypothetical protein
MQLIEYRDVVDKAGWQAGPWNDEPDKIQWQDELTGLPCLIVRGSVGALCGYVGVNPGHPWHGLSYGICPLGAQCPQRNEDNHWCDHTPESVLNVHGGVTFSAGCAGLSRPHWERWCERMLARRDEARQYPRGDAARALAEWATGLEDYDAWVARARGRYVCHLAAPGEPDEVWWFGFDCAHAGDVCPAMSSYGVRSMMGDHGETYKGVAYVTAQCQALAKQLDERKANDRSTSYSRQ